MTDLALFLTVYGLVVFGFAFFLHRIGVGRRQLLFVSHSLFGLLFGLLAALYGYPDGHYVFGLLGVLLSEEVYIWSIDNLGDPHSAFAHYTIPWPLRIPQVSLFTLAILWSLVGLALQLVYNLVKKPAPATKGIVMPVITLSLVALLGISAGAIYATQDEPEKHGPTKPAAYPIMEVGTTPTPGWDNITAWEPENLSVTRWGLEDGSRSDLAFAIGQEIVVTVVVRNVGSERGIAEVELIVNDEAVGSQRAAFLLGETKSVRFALLVPEEGTYTVSVGDLAQGITVKKPDR